MEKGWKEVGRNGWGEEMMRMVDTKREFGHISRHYGYVSLDGVDFKIGITMRISLSNYLIKRNFIFIPILEEHQNIRFSKIYSKFFSSI